MQKITFQKINELDYRANESYKTLRTNIQFCGDDIKVIMATSCTPNEGKSSVCFNLSRSLAENGKKVVLLDTDLRKSVLAGRYKIGEAVDGLSHYLSGQKKLEDVLYNTNVEGMDIIFSGKVPPNPVELLGHQRFDRVMGKLKESYDFIIIDSPPLGSVIDSAVIAPKCDGVILVIENNAISYKFAQDVKQQLDKTNCRILGAVLNKVVMDKKRYYGRYYGKYYGRYYGKYYGNYGENDK